MIKAIIKIVDKQELTCEAYAVMSEIMDGKTTQTQKRRFWRAVRKARKPKQ